MKSVVVYSFFIQNTGQNAILPNDFIEPLRVTTKSPWRLLSVESAEAYPSNIKAEWIRIATDTFEMKPLLLNRGDALRALVLITNQDKVVDYDDVRAASPNPEPLWTARIINVPSIQVIRSELKEAGGLGPFFFRVSFSGWELYWFAFISIILFIIGVELQNRFRRIPQNKWWYRIVMIAIMALALATADTILVPFSPGSTYVWASYLLLVLHMCLLVYLLWPAIAKKSKSQVQSDDLLGNLLENKPQQHK